MGTYPGDGTTPTGIDAAGNIVGIYNVGGYNYGFVRAASTGTITTINVTGAQDQLTKAFSINAISGVVGYYLDPHYTFQGFLRSTSGTITAPLTAPDAGSYWSTQAFSNLAIYLTPATPACSVFGCGRGLSQNVA